VQELNIGLKPCMVTSYEQGFAWKKARDRPRAHQACSELPRREDGQPGICEAPAAPPSAAEPGRLPTTVKGTQNPAAAAARCRPEVPEEAGGIISAVRARTNLPGDADRVADAAVTSSTSLISFRLEGNFQGAHPAAARVSGSCWSGAGDGEEHVRPRLTPAEQNAVQDVGQELESFRDRCGESRRRRGWPDVYRKAGAKVADMDDATVNRLAQRSPRRRRGADFAKRNADCERLPEDGQGRSLERPARDGGPQRRRPGSRAV